MEIEVKKINGELALKVPYNEDLISKVRNIKGRKWNPEIKRWLLPDTEESMKAVKALQ